MSPHLNIWENFQQKQKKSVVFAGFCMWVEALNDLLLSILFHLTIEF